MLKRKDPFKSLLTSWWRHVSGRQRASRFFCAARPSMSTGCHTEPEHSREKHFSLKQNMWAVRRWIRRSYLRSLRFFATDISQALDLGLELLCLTGDVLDPLSHLFTLVVDLVTLSERAVQIWVLKLTAGQFNSFVHMIGSESSLISLDTPTLLEHAAPSSPSSSACGCSVWTLCPASWPVLASAGFPQHTSSSAPSASSHTEPSGPGATYRWTQIDQQSWDTSAKQESIYLPQNICICTLN